MEPIPSPLRQGLATANPPGCPGKISLPSTPFFCSRTSQLTDIQSLKGIVGARRFVIGCISRSEDGRYLLEDGSGTIPLNLTVVQTAAGFYTGEQAAAGRV